jgi:ABC-2 type transport system ATP-binding protein
MTVPDASAIVIRSLRKTYRHGSVGVRDINIEIRTGEIFGIIGPDGAGKTTTFQILSGIMEPTAGEVTVFGQPARNARHLIGYLTQMFSLYPDLSLHENLRYAGEMRGLSEAQIKERGDRYLGMFDLLPFSSRLADHLSGGMKKKLALACALVAEPRLLLLDEPTTGVDPISRREFWDALAQLAASGITIVVATPYLDEAERCDRVALMADGLVLDMGTPTSLRTIPGVIRLEIRVPSNDPLDQTAALPKAEEVLTAVSGTHIRDVQRFGDRLDVLVPETDSTGFVQSTLDAKGIVGVDIRIDTPTLENAFVSILRRQSGVKSTTERMAAPPGRPALPHGSTANAATGIGARMLRKVFGDFVAVAGVNLEIRYGEIYGLLGANGAGKTTTIKMLCGLLAPTSGETVLAGAGGQDATRSSSVRQRVGYMSQQFSLYDDLTINENLEFFAGVYGIPTARQRAAKCWVLDFAGLSDRGNQLTRDLPGGWKQRVAFGSATMHDPDVLFLDEPTSGVDPIARRTIWQVINRLADRGVAILVTTHYLEEAEQCNRLGFMSDGQLVAEGTPTSVKGLVGGQLYVLQTNQPQRADAVLKKQMEPWRCSLFGDRLHVIIDGDRETGIAGVTQQLKDAGILVQQVDQGHVSLEDAFISIIQRNRHRVSNSSATES